MINENTEAKAIGSYIWLLIKIKDKKKPLPKQEEVF